MKAGACYQRLPFGMPRLIRSVFAGLLGLAMTAFSPFGHAAFINGTFSGLVDSAAFFGTSAPLPVNVQVGMPITGQFSYSTQPDLQISTCAPGTSQCNAGNFYNNGDARLTLDVNGLRWSSSLPTVGVHAIYDAINPLPLQGTSDRFGMDAGCSGPDCVGTFPGPLGPTGLSFQLRSLNDVGTNGVLLGRNQGPFVPSSASSFSLAAIDSAVGQINSLVPGTTQSWRITYGIDPLSIRLSESATMPALTPTATVPEPRLSPDLLTASLGSAAGDVLRERNSYLEAIRAIEECGIEPECDDIAERKQKAEEQAAELARDLGEIAVRSTVSLETISLPAPGEVFEATTLGRILNFAQFIEFLKATWTNTIDFSRSLFSNTDDSNVAAATAAATAELEPVIINSVTGSLASRLEGDLSLNVYDLDIVLYVKGILREHRARGSLCVAIWHWPVCDCLGRLLCAGRN